jgi:hypothetical protein
MPMVVPSTMPVPVMAAPSDLLRLELIDFVL